MTSSTMISKLSHKTLQEVAFYFSSSSDINALSLTNKNIRTSIETALVYRQRIINAGWDAEDWSFDRPEWQSREFYAYLLANMQSLQRWKASDRTYAKLESFMDSAVADDNGYFYHSSALYPMTKSISLPALSFPSWGAPLLDCESKVSPFHKFNPTKWRLNESEVNKTKVKIIDGQKTFRWIRNMGELLFMVTVQNRTNNVQKLLQSDFLSVWNVALRALIGLSFTPALTQGSYDSDVDKEYLKLYYSNALERFNFSLLYLFLQSDKKCLAKQTISQIEYPAWFALIDRYFDPSSSEFVRNMFEVRVDRRRPELVSRRFSACFLIQILIIIRVHCYHSLSGDQDRSFEYLLPDLKLPTQGDVMVWARSALCSESPADLQHGILGTPLAIMDDKGPGGPMNWEGYCLDQNGPYWHKDAPQSMDFLLMASSPDDGIPQNKRNLRIKGAGDGDKGEQVLLFGFCDRRTGTVTIQVRRNERVDNFRGVATPFGMAGRWDSEDKGKEELGGWWFFWPTDTPTDSEVEDGSDDLVDADDEETEEDN